MLYENISISVLDTEYLLPIHLLWEHINVLPLRFFDNLHDLLNFEDHCIANKLENEILSLFYEIIKINCTDLYIRRHESNEMKIK